MSQELKSKALRLVLNCVRNTYLEDLHAGISPSSKTGDYSDVVVKSPYGEIPWEQLSRIGQDEMKKLMIEVVNKVYTFFLLEHQLSKSFFFQTPRDWYEPEIDQEFAKFATKIEESGGEISDSLSILEKLIESWCDFSADPTIFEHAQYYRGILMGLIAAGKISFYESQTIWMPKIQKRADLLLALRRAVKRKELRAKDVIDFEGLESGHWVAVDYAEAIISDPCPWDKLESYRERAMLIPESLAKLEKKRSK